MGIKLSGAAQLIDQPPCARTQRGVPEAALERTERLLPLLLAPSQRCFALEVAHSGAAMRTSGHTWSP